MENNKVILIILDGWGIGKKDASDAIFSANTPHMDKLFEKYPNSFLNASGEHVGLPEGQMGNSEVGHLNIGAGRVVYQDLVRINLAIKDGSFASHAILNEAFQYAKEFGKKNSPARPGFRWWCAFDGYPFICHLRCSSCYGN